MLVKQAGHFQPEYMNTKESLAIDLNCFKALHFCEKGNLLDLLGILHKASSNDNLVCFNNQLRHSGTLFFLQSLNFQIPSLPSLIVPFTSTSSPGGFPVQDVILPFGIFF